METYYILQANDSTNMGGKYLETASRGKNGKTYTWTRDFNRAADFYSREDAERFRKEQGYSIPSCRVCVVKPSVEACEE